MIRSYPIQYERKCKYCFLSEAWPTDIRECCAGSKVETIMMINENRMCVCCMQNYASFLTIIEIISYNRWNHQCSASDWKSTPQERVSQTRSLAYNIPLRPWAPKKKIRPELKSYFGGKLDLFLDSCIMNKYLNLLNH